VIIIVGPSLNNQPNRIITFFSAMLGAYLITDIFKIILAKQLRRKLTRDRILLVKKTLGIILIICGIVLIIKGFLPKDQLSIEQGIELIRE
ncbi:MAG: LysE family translocator, partial [Robiginitalea sp.]